MTFTIPPLKPYMSDGRRKPGLREALTSGGCCLIMRLVPLHTRTGKAPCPLTPCKVTGKWQTREGVTPDSKSACNLTWVSQTPEVWEMRFCSLKPPSLWMLLEQLVQTKTFWHVNPSINTLAFPCCVCYEKFLISSFSEVPGWISHMFPAADRTIQLTILGYCEKDTVDTQKNLYKRESGVLRECGTLI